jgi:hypothetical protein
VIADIIDLLRWLIQGGIETLLCLLTSHPLIARILFTLSDMNLSECCICASNSADLFLDEKLDQPSARMRQFRCCNRIICPICLDKQPRLEHYCPYCQTAGSSIKPIDGEYGIAPKSHLATASEVLQNRISRPEQKDPEKNEEDAPDVLHFVDPANDTIDLLSIRYGVPASVLRKTNNIYADHLLAARKTILISGEYYKGGVAINPRPLDGEEMDMKKSKIRRFMVNCKVIK